MTQDPQARKKRRLLRYRSIPRRAIVAAVGLLLLGGAFVGAAEPAKEDSKARDEPAGILDLTKTTPPKIDNSYNLGPTGALGWMVVEGGMTVKSRQILVTAVEKGSPADGVLELGDVILGVFGKPFTEDARKSLGWAIGEAETEERKGILPLIVWRKGKTRNIALKLQVMGAYSDASPYDCPKAKKILEQGCALIAKDIKQENRFWIAVMTLGQLKARAVPALDVLASLLGDDDRWLRVQAAEALRTIGEAAKPVLPQMLEAATVRDETDPMEFAVGALAYALFYPGGAYGPKGVLADSIEGIAKDLLYPAIRSVAANPDSHARGCLRSTYALLTLDDAKALAPTIVASIKEMAPANTMFSKGVRLAGIRAMARLHIEEGIPLTMMMLNLRDWGRAYIILEALDVLKEYGGAAKPVLPELKAMEVELRKMKPQHDKLMEVIAAIGNDRNPPKLISLKDYLGNDTGRE